LPQIFLHYRRHGHAKSCGKILRGHGLLFVRVSQESNQARSKIFRIARTIELNCQFFTVRHLPEIRQIGAHNRHPISAS
jgi:hypothetical protein